MAKPKKLNILMLTEYFHPHDRGGSERSTLFLAKHLLAKGHRVSILTPNYGSKTTETWQGLKIDRFKIGIQLQKPSDVVTPFWHANVFWYLKSLVSLINATDKHPDIIHVQGKYFLPAAVITAKIRGIPVVFTVRDYQMICNLGLCLWQSKTRCTWPDYLFKQLPRYLRIYFPSSLPAKKFILLWGAIHHRVTADVLGFFSRMTTRVVCISRSQQKILAANGIKNTTTIYNSATFSHIDAGQKKNQLLFVGRLTPGKGADLVIPSFHKALGRQKTKLVIIGAGILKPQLKSQINSYQLEKRVQLTGFIPHAQVIKQLKQSKLAIFPSIWPEPFGRAALEAISQGTPVVTSNRGGLPEIVQDKYGISVEPTVANLTKAISQVIKHRAKFAGRIRNDRQALIKKFSHQPTNQYEKLYYGLLKLKQ